MKIPHPNTLRESEDKLARRWLIVTFAAYGLIMAGCLALTARGHAADATADYVAPLDMTSSYAEDVMGYPVVASKAPSQRASGAETTGVDSTRTTADIAAPAAQASDVLVENGWDFNDLNSIPGFGPMPQPGIALTDDATRMVARSSK